MRPQIRSAFNGAGLDRERFERGAPSFDAANRFANDVPPVRTGADFARQQPAFHGASFAAGFALARFGKIVAADISRNDLPTLPEVGHGQG